jgi:hypothetical protein
MQVKTISVNYGVTRNLGNYESLRLDYSMEVELTPRESVTDTYDKIRRRLKRLVSQATIEEVKTIR